MGGSSRWGVLLGSIGGKKDKNVTNMIFGS